MAITAAVILLMTLLTALTVWAARQRMTAQSMGADAIAAEVLIYTGLDEAMEIAFSGTEFDLPDPTDPEQSDGWSETFQSRLAIGAGASMKYVFRFARDSNDVDSNGDTHQFFYYDPSMRIDQIDNPEALFGGSDDIVDNESAVSLQPCPNCLGVGMPVLEVTLEANVRGVIRRRIAWVGADLLNLAGGILTAGQPGGSFAQMSGFLTVNPLDGKIRSDDRAWKRFLAGADTRWEAWPPEKPGGFVYLEPPEGATVELGPTLSLTTPEKPAILYIHGDASVHGKWVWHGLVYIEGRFEIHKTNPSQIFGALVVQNEEAPRRMFDDINVLAELSMTESVPTLLGIWAP